MAAFEALVDLVAACLAAEGDEEPVGVRRSKALGVIGHQARLRDLLARHADQPDDPRHPEDRVAAHQDDPTDPWAADDLPPAGWETEKHGNYHQPGLDDVEDLDDCWASRTDHDDVEADFWDEELVDQTDREWAEHHDPADHTNTAGSDGEPAPTDPAAQPGKPSTPVPAAFDRDRAVRDHRGACTGCGSTFDLRPYSKAELAGCRTKVVVHVHVTDQTLIDQHGVLRTEDGPITLDQFRRWLTDADPTISIRPVLDPAAVAAVDSYEIPLAIREAVHTRHPGSVFPLSPVTAISTAAGSTSTTPSPTEPTGHPDRPRSTSSDPSPAASTNPKPTAAGRPDNPTPASTSGDHRTAGSPSSPTKAPCCSATTPTPTPSGRPPNQPPSPPPPADSVGTSLTPPDRGIKTQWESAILVELA